MNFTYKLSPFPIMIIRSDGTWIPTDPDNSDYQAFLAWKAEGNEPLPADEGEQA